MEFLNECTTDQITEWRAEADSLRAEIRATPNMEIPDDAVVYYISESGDDENDGRSPETAWKTIDRMSREALPYGSYVCFERGGVYRGKLDASAGVTYTAYGEGDKPRIYGSPFNGAEHGEWMEVADNIWRYSEKFTGDVGGIVMNGGEAHGIKRLVVYRETGMTDTITGESFTGYQDLRGELDFYHDLGGQVNENSDGGYLYLRCEAGNPGELWDSIEFLTYWHIINCGTNPDITIDNLCVMYGGSHGISTGDIQNLTVTNCEIGWIGGSIQFYRSNSPTRYGNGIEVYGSCDGYIIDHCYVYECYDAGITHQIARGNRNVTHQNVRYTNNLIERCVYNIEYFLGYSTSPSTVRWMADILISGNILANAGYGWGRQRPDKYNPASIKSWDMMNTLAGEFLIEDNLILFSDNMMLHIGAETSDDLPTFRNNTLVQYVGGKLGWYMQNPTEQLLYTDESIDKFGIGDNEFYVARND